MRSLQKELSVVSVRLPNTINKVPRNSVYLLASLIGGSASALNNAQADVFISFTDSAVAQKFFRVTGEPGLYITLLGNLPLIKATRCHDEASEHPNEHANRMIWSVKPFWPSSEAITANLDVCSGFCSREQPYRPEDCIHCRSTLMGRRGTGFWEGGKGTRDKVRMSRKGTSCLNRSTRIASHALV